MQFSKSIRSAENFMIQQAQEWWKIIKLEGFERKRGHCHQKIITKIYQKWEKDFGRLDKTREIAAEITDSSSIWERCGTSRDKYGETFEGQSSKHPHPKEGYMLRTESATLLLQNLRTSLTAPWKKLRLSSFKRTIGKNGFCKTDTVINEYIIKKEWPEVLTCV